MRHLWSLLAGVVAAPVAWLFIATGQHRSTQTVAAWDRDGVFDTADLIGPASFLVGAGILLGVLGTLRVSPAGPLATGVLFVLPTILMFNNPFRTLDAFSFDERSRLFGQDFQPWLPVVNGTLLVLGVLLLMAVFSARRWRQRPAAPALLPAGVSQRPLQPATATSATATAAATQPQQLSMSDDEILAAAAAMDDEQTGSDTDTGETASEPDTEDETQESGSEPR